jgi:hypothetical protein
MPVVSVKAKARIAAIHCNHGATSWGCRSIKSRQTIAIAVKYPMRSAAIVISASFRQCCGNRRKAVPYVTQETGGEMELFPAH